MHRLRSVRQGLSERGYLDGSDNASAAAEKSGDVTEAARELIRSKAEQEKAAEKIAENTELDGLYRLSKAIAKSNRLMAEDISRESGYMLPQSGNARAALKDLVENPPSKDFPIDTAKELLRRIPCNDEEK